MKNIALNCCTAVVLFYGFAWEIPQSFTLAQEAEKPDPVVAAEKELRQLAGDWKLLFQDEQGTVVDFQGEHPIYSFEKNRLTVRRNGEITADGFIEIDASKTPLQMNYRLNTGQVDLIIFMRMGDFLIECGHRDGVTRPAEFATDSPHGGAYLVVFRKQK